MIEWLLNVVPQVAAGAHAPAIGRHEIVDGPMAPFHPIINCKCAEVIAEPVGIEDRSNLSRERRESHSENPPTSRCSSDAWLSGSMVET
jgi:hypothetical protein